MKKIGLICLAIVLVLAGLGVGYATWKDDVQIDGTVEMGALTLAFDPDELLTCVDNEDLLPVPKDIGWGEIYYDPDSYIYDDHTDKYGYKTLVLKVHGAYPSYEIHFPTVVVRNIGTIPAHITDINLWDPTGELQWKWVLGPPQAPGDPAVGFFWKDFNGNGSYDADEEVINVDIVNFVCVQLEPCESTKGEIDLHFKEAAEECHEYSFKISIVGVQWNKYVP